MSFLERLADPAVLTEALAFIDAFDLTASGGSEAEATSGSSDGAAEELSKRRRGDAPPDKFEQSKTKRKNALYSARLRAKKKSEREQLKEQIARLELQLQLQLQRLQQGGRLSASSSPLSTGQIPATSTRWLEEAAEQALKRQKAELLNVQLKMYLAKVMTTSSTLQTTFQNFHALKNEIGAAVGPPSTILAEPSLRSNDATPQLGDLRAHLDQMYTEAQSVFALDEATGASSFQLQTKHDPKSGGVFGQIMSATPVGCDLDTASRMVWNGMQLKGGLCCKEFVHRFHLNANVVAKSYYLNVKDRQDTCMLHGVSMVRKFEERDRILYMWTSAIIPPQHDQNADPIGIKRRSLCFREKGWAMLSRVPDNPDHAAVFHTKYEVFNDPQHGAGGYESARRDFEQLCYGVVETLSASMRLFHEGVQNTLLEEAPPQQVA